jgi:hypothetical protein
VDVAFGIEESDARELVVEEGEHLGPATGASRSRA